MVTTKIRTSGRSHGIEWQDRGKLEIVKNMQGSSRGLFNAPVVSGGKEEHCENVK
jgi:hypothetical protein